MMVHLALATPALAGEHLNFERVTLSGMQSLKLGRVELWNSEADMPLPSKKCWKGTFLGPERR
jgi:hypothetical protein